MSIITDSSNNPAKVPVCRCILFVLEGQRGPVGQIVYDLVIPSKDFGF